jgi:hypothetical protein
VKVTMTIELTEHEVARAIIAYVRENGQAGVEQYIIDSECAVRHVSCGAPLTSDTPAMTLTWTSEPTQPRGPYR